MRGAVIKRSLKRSSSVRESIHRISWASNFVPLLANLAKTCTRHKENEALAEIMSLSYLAV